MGRLPFCPSLAMVGRTSDSLRQTYGGCGRQTDIRKDRERERDRQREGKREKERKKEKMSIILSYPDQSYVDRPMIYTVG